MVAASPASFSWPASATSSRAARTSVTMSETFAWISCRSRSGAPPTLRRVVYEAQASRQAWMMPTEPLATLYRPRSSVPVSTMPAVKPLGPSSASGPEQHVGEAHLAEHRASGAHDVPDRGDPDAGRVARHQEGGDAGTEAGEHQIEIRPLPVGDPFLGTVEHEAVAGRFGDGPDAGGVAAGLRLGQAERPEHPAGGEIRRPAVALLGGAPPLQRPGQHGVHGEQAADRGTGPAHLLVNLTERHHGQPRPAYLRRQERGPQPGGGHPLEQLLGNPAGAFELVAVRGDVLGGEGVRRGTVEDLLAERVVRRQQDRCGGHD